MKQVKGPKVYGKKKRKETIIITSRHHDDFYNLSEVIPEMMEAENLTQKECIRYFMDCLNCERARVFAEGTDIRKIASWILDKPISEV